MSELFNAEKVLEACDRFLYFLKINLLFLLFNLPVLMFFLFQGISQVRTYLPFFLLCMIPAAPALCAVFFSMNRLLHGIETTAWNDFKTGYTDSFGKKILLGAIQGIGILMFWTNVEFFLVQIPIFPLAVIFFILFAAVLLMTPNLYLLASRYDMTVVDYIKGAVVLTVTKPILTLGNIAVIAFVLMLIEIKAGTFVLFMASIYGFLIVFMNRNVVKILDENAEKSKEKEGQKYE